MDMRTPLLRMKIMLESNPLESRILVRRLGVLGPTGTWLPSLSLAGSDGICLDYAVLRGMFPWRARYPNS